MEYIKPKKLEAGDVVAIVSPSWGGPSVFPDVYENGLKILESWGLKIKEYPTARGDADFLRNNPKMRAKDINDAFSNPEVKAIFASIGGDDSIRILPHLDKDIIRKNPKILMGYSDTTSLHVFCNQLGLVTFYGPSIMAGFSQMKSLPASFESHVKEILFSPKLNYEYHAYDKYSDGYPNWSNKENLGKVNILEINTGWNWLQGKGIAQGELFGGCLEVLEMIKGTDFWPDKHFWKGKILILETSEEKPSLHQIDHALRNYGMQDVFDNINGLIFAKARDFSGDEKSQLEEKIVSIVSKEFGRNSLPIVANVDFGHTDPQLVLPVGIKIEIDCENKKLKLIETWLG